MWSFLARAIRDSVNPSTNNDWFPIGYYPQRRIKPLEEEINKRNVRWN